MSQEFQASEWVCWHHSISVVSLSTTTESMGSIYRAFWCCAALLFIRKPGSVCCKQDTEAAAYTILLVSSYASYRHISGSTPHLNLFVSCFFFIFGTLGHTGDSGWTRHWTHKLFKKKRHWGCTGKCTLSAGPKPIAKVRRAASGSVSGLKTCAKPMCRP